MIKAYILTEMQPGDYNKAVKEMKKIENIKKISITAGDYDIIIRAEVSHIKDLLKLTNKIHMIDGVNKTKTQVIEKELAHSGLYKDISSKR
jgi:DNA-binding Lrp family transcriptional regulator